VGYSTTFTLSILDGEGDKTISEILEIVEGEFEGLGYAVDENGETSEGVNWYNHEADMHFLSKEFPDEVFVLHGEGEENDDIWYKYFKNGKKQVCHAKVTFDEYDESKLV
jgi:antitoxin component YwqK of YwqJK toxin-antitoxin module